MQAYNLAREESQPRKPSFEYLRYARFCAVSAVTGGPVEEMNGIPIPAQLVYDRLELSESNLRKQATDLLFR
jgi:hypothetical protein